MQPNVETMMASAMIAVPEPGRITSRAAVATRSEGACWIAASGSVTRYATFASRYSAITNEDPSARDSGRFRRGSFTSPAVNVTLCQESAANSEPVCTTQIATNRPNQVAASRPAAIGS